MRKIKKFIAATMLGIIIFTCSGCSVINVGEESGFVFGNQRLVQIQGEDDLYFDTNTKVVYIVCNEHIGNFGYGYMSEYIAPNGLPYKYVDGKLKEIKKWFLQSTTIDL